MQAATGGPGGLPSTFTHSVFSAENGGASSDSNWPSIIHALMASLSFILLMPTGVLFLRVWPGNVRWHWLNQSLSLIGVIVGGVGIGVYLSTMYTKSDNYESAHQILGLIVSALIAAQWAIGAWHHRLYKLLLRTTSYALIHRHLGRLLLVLGIVNGGIGLTWSRASLGVVVVYSVGVVCVGIGFLGVLAWKSRRESVKRKTLRQQIMEMLSRERIPDGSASPSHGSESDINLGEPVDPERFFLVRRLANETA